ncbi:hypothetical protein [Altibacter sp. HG106]|uniref:hypothetical protein n=1 Tax=Altibacter sp. HG106 TaxID=3023937 RepID=UPI002350CBF1|nr:hypothetical protein [Altibacter sp. HG106]MDC7994043.1 hypothetical protein [Altibacter sp. HG106]
MGGIFTKLSLLDKLTPPSYNLDLINSILRLIRSTAYQSQIDKFSLFVLAVYDSSSVIEGNGIKLTDIFTTTLISDYNLDEANIVEINNKGELIESKKFGRKRILFYDEGFEISTFNKEVKFFIIDGNSLHIFFEGNYVKAIPNIFNQNDWRGQHHRISIQEVESVLERYRNSFPKDYKPSWYWQNKKDRILKKEPEVLLGMFFYQFLDRIISDAKIDGECFNSNTDDKLDVRAVHYETGDLYIFEVKWIGESETGTKYLDEKAHERANEGIEQLKIYIDHENDCKVGVLVLYDGRPNDEKINWLDTEKWDSKIYDPPFRLYMETTSASVAATKIIRTKKREKNN